MTIAPGSSPEAEARGMLQTAGLRVTPQRVAVLGALGEARGRHLSADEVWQRLGAEDAPMDRSTAFRVLADLNAAGLLAQVRLTDGVGRFELPRDEHHHAVCTVCGRTLDVRVSDVAPLAAALQREHGFRLDAQPLLLTGTCGDCAG